MTKATTTLIIHFMAAVALSDLSAADIALNPFITNIIIAKKKINAFKKAIILNHIESLLHCAACTSPSVHCKDETSNTVPNIHVTPKNNTAPYNIYTRDIK